MSQLGWLVGWLVGKLQGLLGGDFELGRNRGVSWRNHVLKHVFLNFCEFFEVVLLELDSNS